MTTIISTKTLNRENGIGQDFSTSGYGSDKFGDYAYLVVADGHGKGTYYKFISSNKTDWKRIVSMSTAKEILRELELELKKNKTFDKTDFTNDGSTLSIVKIYKNMLKCFWIGDSQIRVYKNKREVFKSKNHNAKNKKEIMRLQENNIQHTIKNVSTLKVVDDNTLTTKKTQQIHFHTNCKCEKMMISRALGHNTKLFPVFQTKTLFIDSENLTVVIASDGFWDMYCDSEKWMKTIHKSSACELAEYALKKWNQSWQLKNKPACSNYKLSTKNIDDVSVAMFRNESSNLINIVID